MAKIILTQKDIDRFFAKTKRNEATGCLEWTAARSKRRGGYGSFSLSTGHARVRTRGAHRVAWQIAYGNIPPGLLVCHHCDNPPCVEISHLCLGSRAFNVSDMVAKGREAKGDRLPQTKLSISSVREIRRLAANGNTQRGLATRFGVCVQTVCLLVNGKTWRHVV